eukprot:587705-Amphidinium_carterae.1
MTSDSVQTRSELVPMLANHVRHLLPVFNFTTQENATLHPLALGACELGPLQISCLRELSDFISDLAVCIVLRLPVTAGGAVDGGLDGTYSRKKEFKNKLLLEDARAIKEEEKFEEKFDSYLGAFRDSHGRCFNQHEPTHHTSVLYLVGLELRAPSLWRKCPNMHFLNTFKRRF